MAITGVKVASLAAFILVGVAACAVQSGEDETGAQSEAMQDLPKCDICCAKGGTWDSAHWMCCIPTRGGGSVCTNRPEDIKDVKLDPTPTPTTNPVWPPIVAPIGSGVLTSAP